jgi:hypothetical protein
MTARADWFTFADRAAVAAEYAAGPQDLAEVAPGIWGIPGLAVVCIGDRAQMRKVQAKRFFDRFHAGPCPMGFYDDDHGGPALPPVSERLAA